MILCLVSQNSMLGICSSEPSTLSPVLQVTGPAQAFCAIACQMRSIGGLCTALTRRGPGRLYMLQHFNWRTLYSKQPGGYSRQPGVYSRRHGVYWRHPGMYSRQPGVYWRKPGVLAIPQTSNPIQLACRSPGSIWKGDKGATSTERGIEALVSCMSYAACPLPQYAMQIKSPIAQQRLQC